LLSERTPFFTARQSEMPGILFGDGFNVQESRLCSDTPAVSLDSVSFIRGLFDTDGCVYRKYWPYIQIQFKSASLSLLDYARQNLAKLGLNPTSTSSDDARFRFFLGRQAEVDSFLRDVKPKNGKHLGIVQDAPGKPSYHRYDTMLEYREDRNRPNLIATILKKTHSVG
jgi:LAGLIDADG-like domain